MGVGGFHAGGGRKVRALPRKFVFLGFRKEEPVAGMFPTPAGVQKFVQSKFVFIFRPLHVQETRRGPEIHG